jgi:hypothetical protein
MGTGERVELSKEREIIVKFKDVEFIDEDGG